MALDETLAQAVIDAARAYIRQVPRPEERKAFWVALVRDLIASGELEIEIVKKT